MAHHALRLEDSLSIRDQVTRVVDYVRSGTLPALRTAASGRVGVSGARDIDLSVRFQVEVTAPWLVPSELSRRDRTFIALIASLGANFAMAKDASPELMLFTGVALYLLLEKFERRFPNSSD